MEAPPREPITTLRRTRSYGTRQCLEKLAATIPYQAGVEMPPASLLTHPHERSRRQLHRVAEEGGDERKHRCEVDNHGGKGEGRADRDRTTLVSGN